MITEIKDYFKKYPGDSEHIKDYFPRELNINQDYYATQVFSFKNCLLYTSDAADES